MIIIASMGFRVFPKKNVGGQSKVVWQRMDDRINRPSIIICNIPRVRHELCPVVDNVIDPNLFCRLRQQRDVVSNCTITLPQCPIYWGQYLLVW